MTGLYPYGRFDITDRLSAWGLAGTGSGTIALEREAGRRLETDLSLRLAAAGLRGEVLDGTGPSGLRLSVKADTTWVGTKSARSADLIAAEGKTTRVRLMVESEKTFELGERATLTPSVELGLRHDGGDAETGASVELGGGLHYSLGRLQLDAQARVLAAHEDSGLEEWGASAGLLYSPREDGTGLTLSLRPQWRETQSATETLWGARHGGELAGAEGFNAEHRIDAEAGFALRLRRNAGLLTPYAGMALQGSSGGRSMRGGLRWTFADALSVGLEATQDRNAGGDSSEALNARANIRF